jgi:hypothetical protein
VTIYFHNNIVFVRFAGLCRLDSQELLTTPYIAFCYRISSRYVHCLAPLKDRLHGDTDTSPATLSNSLTYFMLHDLPRKVYIISACPWIYGTGNSSSCLQKYIITTDPEATEISPHISTLVLHDQFQRYGPVYILLSRTISLEISRAICSMHFSLPHVFIHLSLLDSATLTIFS